ncbi:hypothetical protein TNCT_602461, partial [Trichonephila clavata]
MPEQAAGGAGVDTEEVLEPGAGADCWCRSRSWWCWRLRRTRW